MARVVAANGHIAWRGTWKPNGDPACLMAKRTRIAKHDIVSFPPPLAGERRDKLPGQIASAG